MTLQTLETSLRGVKQSEAELHTSEAFWLKSLSHRVWMTASLKLHAHSSHSLEVIHLQWSANYCFNPKVASSFLFMWRRGGDEMVKTCLVLTDIEAESEEEDDDDDDDGKKVSADRRPPPPSLCCGSPVCRGFTVVIVGPVVNVCAFGFMLFCRLLHSSSTLLLSDFACGWDLRGWNQLVSPAA